MHFTTSKVVKFFAEPVKSMLSGLVPKEKNHLWIVKKEASFLLSQTSQQSVQRASTN